MTRTRLASLALLGALAAAPVASNAQSISFGLMAGGSLSTFTGGSLADDARNYGGFIAGGFAHLSLAGFAVEPGLYYTAKGSKREETETTVTNKLNYVQVPLVIKVKLPILKGFYVGAGPAIGINVGCSFSVENLDGAKVNEDCDSGGEEAFAKAASTEISAIGVAGLEFGKFSLGLRGDFGVSNSYKSLSDVTAQKPDLKTRTISAIASIRF